MGARKYFIALDKQIAAKAKKLADARAKYKPVDAFDVTSADEFIAGRVKKKKRKRRSTGRKALRRAKYEAYINSPEWKLFRVTVFAARGRKCERCCTIKGEMHVHHLHYRNFGKEKLEDVQILCERCHKAEHGR